MPHEEVIIYLGLKRFQCIPNRSPDGWECIITHRHNNNDHRVNTDHLADNDKCEKSLWQLVYSSFIIQKHIKHSTDKSHNMDLKCLALTSVLMVQLLAAQRGM